MPCPLLPPSNRFFLGLHTSPFFSLSLTLPVTMWKSVVLLHLVIGSLGSGLENSLEGETVKEVELLLAKDPNLPRLTKGEILSLISEIRQGKDVMIVLPQDDTNTSTATPIPETTERSTTKRPTKRRRKPLRPVYRHTTTTTSTAKPPPNIEEQTQPDIVRPLYITPETTTTSFLPITRPTVRATIRTTTTATATSPPPHIVEQTMENRPDISAAAESLAPDMKQLLNSFGLLGPSSTTERATFQGSLTPTVDPSSYSRFKPLPLESDGMSPEMKSFLSSYGLLDNRKGKSVQINNLDHIPGKDILKEMGLLKGRKLNHIFNPATVNQNNSLELEKVNKILTKLRKFSEGNGTDLTKDEVDELLLLENNTRLAFQDGIDPAGDIYQELDYKNEIKRQQPNTTEREETEEATIPAFNDTETTTEMAEPMMIDTGASAAELEESFGEGDPTTVRPNGFYFLLDWNSFLDVGLEERKVNINFSPKVGDPRQFIPVTIP